MNFLPNFYYLTYIMKIIWKLFLFTFLVLLVSCDIVQVSEESFLPSSQQIWEYIYSKDIQMIGDIIDKVSKSPLNCQQKRQNLICLIGRIGYINRIVEESFSGETPEMGESDFQEFVILQEEAHRIHSQIEELYDIVNEIEKILYYEQKAAANTISLDELQDGINLITKNVEDRLDQEDDIQWNRVHTQMTSKISFANDLVVQYEGYLRQIYQFNLNIQNLKEELKGKENQETINAIEAQISLNEQSIKDVESDIYENDKTFNQTIFELRAYNLLPIWKVVFLELSIFYGETLSQIAFKKAENQNVSEMIRKNLKNVGKLSNYHEFLEKVQKSLFACLDISANIFINEQKGSAVSSLIQGSIDEYLNQIFGNSTIDNLTAYDIIQPSYVLNTPFIYKDIFSKDWAEKNGSPLPNMIIEAHREKSQREIMYGKVQEIKGNSMKISKSNEEKVTAYVAICSKLYEISEYNSHIVLLAFKQNGQYIVEVGIFYGQKPKPQIPTFIIQTESVKLPEHIADP